MLFSYARAIFLGKTYMYILWSWQTNCCRYHDTPHAELNSVDVPCVCNQRDRAHLLFIH